MEGNTLHRYIYIYLGEELDVIADLDEVELLVELEDVHPAPRASSVEDHRVPPGRRPAASSCDDAVVLILRCQLELAVVVGFVAALPAKRCGGRCRGRGEEQEEKQLTKAGDASH